MKPAKVIGTVTSTIKHERYAGRRLLYCRYTRPDGSPTKSGVIAVDTVNAGRGDWVLINREGNATRQVLGKDAGPILELIVGIIDRIDYRKEMEQ